MKKALLTLALCLSSATFAQTHTVTGNVAFLTDYGTKNTTKPYVIFGLEGTSDISGACIHGFGFEHAWSSFQSTMLLEAYSTRTKIMINVDDNLHPSGNQNVCGVTFMGYWEQ